MPVPAILAVLKGVAAPFMKIVMSMVLPLLTDKLAKQAAYRILKAKADKYEAQARESAGLEDDKQAEFYKGIVKDLATAWGIEN